MDISGGDIEKTKKADVTAADPTMDTTQSTHDDSAMFVSTEMIADSDGSSKNISPDIDESRVDEIDNSFNTVLVSVDPSVLHLMNGSDDPDERTAYAFCDSCCDLRRACIIVDIIYITYSIVGAYVGFDFLKPADLSEFDDDDQILQQESSFRQSGALFYTVVGTSVFGVLFAAIGIYGAARFQKYPVLCSGIGYCLGCVASCVLKNWIGALLKGVFAYPQFVLFRAFRDGTITRENYASEKLCCGDGNPPV